ncbi:MAG TPA: thiamine pyrophosphate-binding protein [Galbitalea sp.]|jgi:acetolactate synthase-1/2/3 large subunit/sulfoacetaldehyde acetyltransferase
MGKISGGEAVIQTLRKQGVTHVFGVIGTAMLDVYDALHDAPDITYVGTRHEQNAVHMADAFARITGRAGVVFAGQPGPGVTNLVSGIAEARLAFSPLVIIAGDTSTAQVDRGTFQEVDQQSLLAPVTKRTVTVRSAARIAEYVDEAFLVSQSGRQGPVVVNIPGDLLAAEVDESTVAVRARQAGAAPAPSELARAVEVLRLARRPLILGGAGIKWANASAAFARFVDVLDVPVAASPGNGDIIANDHPLYVGQVGPRGNVVATELLRSADVVLALGTRLSYNTTLFKAENLAQGVKIIQVDVEPMAVGRYFPADVAIVSDAGAFLAAVPASDAVAERESGWVDGARERRRDLLAARADAVASHTGALSPAIVYAALAQNLPRDVIVTVDTGTASLHAVDGMQTYQSPGLLTPLDFGIVGFSYPAGIGAKAAAPERPVVSIIGDGGFSMAMIELATARESGLPTTTIVINNGCWGAEKAYQRDFFDGRYTGSDIFNPRFDEVARAYGCVGVRAETVDELLTAVRAALGSDVPTVIEVTVDPDSITSFRKDSFPHRKAAS